MYIHTTRLSQKIPGLENFKVETYYYIKKHIFNINLHFNPLSCECFPSVKKIDLMVAQINLLFRFKIPLSYYFSFNHSYKFSMNVRWEIQIFSNLKGFRFGLILNANSILSVQCLNSIWGVIPSSIYILFTMNDSNITNMFI